MKNIGIVGAGTMGCGVANLLVQKGYNVILLDCDENVLLEAKNQIKTSIRFSNIGGKMQISADEVLEKILFTKDYGQLEEAEFIVENIVEKYKDKVEVYQKLDKICKQDVIFAANTSCISITKLAAGTRRADKFIGIHFMNPVTLIEGIEVIKGYHTSETTLNETLEFLKELGKQAIVIDDFPGFVSNRISHLMMNEAAFIIQDHYATQEDVDNIFVKCYGHKMGPLETADLIGLDTVVNSLDVLYESYKDSKYRCCPLLRKMVDAGLKGRKSGEGFYKYF